MHLSDYERQLATRTLRRKHLFLALSIVSVAIALGLAAWYAWAAHTRPETNSGLHFVVVVLILLNARQNLRQYNFARILEVIWDPGRDEPAG